MAEKDETSTRKKKQPEYDLAAYKDMLAISHRKFKKEAEESIRRGRDYYRGKQWAAEIKGYSDKCVDNMVFSNVKTLIPSLNFRNPKIYVTSRKAPYQTKEGLFDTYGGAVAFETLLNYYFKELEIKKQFDKCLVDALTGPWAHIQLGYTVETEKMDKDGDLIEENELIRAESPFVLRRSPLDVRIDPSSKNSDLSDARWIAFRWVKTLDDIKKNPAYSNTDDLKTNSNIDTEYKLATSSADGYVMKDAEKWERVEGWELWDRKCNRVFNIVESHDKFLSNEEWPIDLDGFPLENLYFNENPDELYPISDIDIIQKLQDELNRIRSLQLSHIKKISQRKYVAREDSMSQDEMEKITSGPDGTIAFTKTDPNNAIVPLKDANISQDIYIIARQLKDDIRTLAGVALIEQGVAQKFDTATEPAIMAQAASVRKSERRTIFESFIVRVIRKLGQILQQTLEKQEIALNTEQFAIAQKYIPNKLSKIAGDKGAIVLNPWLTVERSTIQGEYDFNIEVGSTTPVDDMRRKQDALTLGQALANNPYINAYEGTKRLLEAFETRDIDTLLKEETQVVDEETAKAQAIQQSEMMKDEPKRQVDMAKTKMKTDTNLLVAALKMAAPKGGGGDKGGNNAIV